MTDRRKQGTRLAVIPTIEIIDEEVKHVDSIRNRSPSVVTQEKTLEPSPRIPKAIHYTPPDSLMFPLFNAIQRKAWPRAKRLCHELNLCDPGRKSYYELYIKLDQITNLIDRRLHPQSATSRTTTSSRNEERSSQQ